MGLSENAQKQVDARIEELWVAYKSGAAAMAKIAGADNEARDVIKASFTDWMVMEHPATCLYIEPEKLT